MVNKDFVRYGPAKVQQFIDLLVTSVKEHRLASGHTIEEWIDQSGGWASLTLH